MGHPGEERLDTPGPAKQQVGEESRGITRRTAVSQTTAHGHKNSRTFPSPLPTVSQHSARSLSRHGTVHPTPCLPPGANAASVPGKGRKSSPQSIGRADRCLLFFRAPHSWVDEGGGPTGICTFQCQLPAGQQKSVPSVTPPHLAHSPVHAGRLPRPPPPLS